MGTLRMGTGGCGSAGVGAGAGKGGTGGGSDDSGTEVGLRSSFGGAVDWKRDWEGRGGVGERRRLSSSSES